MSAAIGTHVELELVGEGGALERLALDIVADAQADFSHGFLGAGTPLARAILGHSSGSVVPYRVGDVVEVRVLSVAPSAGAPGEDIAARRRAALEAARARAEMTNDAIFALTAGSKWGDYDPAKLADPWQAPRKPEEGEEKDEGGA